MRQKITTRTAQQFMSGAPLSGAELHDTELAGFHLRAGTTGGSFRLRYQAPNGQRRSLTLGRYGALTVEQARTEARKQLGAIAGGADPHEARAAQRQAATRQRAQTVGAYLDGPYSVYLSRRKAGDHTAAIIRSHFSGWLSRPMGSLRATDMQTWQAEKESAGLKHATISRTWDALRAMLNHAVRGGMIDNNPLAGFRLERPAMTETELAQGGASRRYLSADDVTKLFSGIEAYQANKREQRQRSRQHGKSYLPDLDAVPYVDHVAPWILTMYYTGLRPGDIFGLRWEHLSITFKTIRRVIEKTAHHNPEPQTFPMSQRLASVLDAWHRQQGQPDTGYVFPSPNRKRAGSRLDKSAMQAPWRFIKEAGGLPAQLDLYSLRHNFASQLVMSGTDLLTVSRLMGHTEIETTIKHYAHLQPDRARACVDAFADAMTPATLRDPENLPVSLVSPVSGSATA